MKGLFRREFAYRFRGLFPFSRPGVGVGCDGSFAKLEAGLSAAAAERFTVLSADYDLSGWTRGSRLLELHESVYFLDLYDSFVRDHVRVQDAARGFCRGLDVGSKNWAYLLALVTAWPGAWTGVEIDAHRRYADFSTRAAVARARAGGFAACRYLAGSVMDLGSAGEGSAGEGRGFDVITWFLPFVCVDALRAWGLPDRFFDPAGLLSHVAGLLASDGVLWVVNQGEKERAAQRLLFAETDLCYETLGEMVSPLSPFRARRFGWLAWNDEG